jgi:aquaporin Z
MRKLLAEFIGTFVLVLFGCGTAILAGQFVGFAGIALAFGLSVFVMAYAVGHISGGHFNPAVSIGLATAGRFSWKSVIPYIIAQVLGASAAAAILYVIATGTVFPAAVGGFAANTYSNYRFAAALLTEVVMTAVFLFVILGATAKESFSAFAGAAIGLALTAIHLVSIPITNTSVNPARSTSQALFSADPAAASQLWLFWVAPIAGAIIAGLLWKYLLEVKKTKR